MKEPQERPKRQLKSKRSTEAAARTFLNAHVGWLRGMPIETSAKGVHWMTLPRPGSGQHAHPLIIDSETLRHAEYGRNATKRRFPRVLSEVVGDVDAWSDRIDAQLGILKRAVHEDTPLPGLDKLLEAVRLRRPTSTKIVALARQHPELTLTLVGLIWLHWHDEEQLALALGAFDVPIFITLMARLVDEEHRVARMRLVQLAADGVPASLFQLFADPAVWGTPCAGGEAGKAIALALKTMRTEGKVDANFVLRGVPRPPVRLAIELTAFAQNLVADDRRTRMLKIELLDLLMPRTVLEQWNQWWIDVGVLERDARRFLGGQQIGLNDTRLGDCQDLERRANALVAPADLHWPGLAAMIDSASALSPALFRHLTGCLKSIIGRAKGHPRAIQFMEWWVPEFKKPQRGWTVIGRLLAGQRRLIEICKDADACNLDWICGALCSEMIDTWIRAGKPQPLIELAMSAIERLASAPVGPEQEPAAFADYHTWDCLMGVLEATGDAKLAAEALSAVRPTSLGLNGQVWLGVLRLAGFDAGRFRSLTEGWVGDEWNHELGQELDRLSRDPLLAPVLADGLATGERRRVGRLIALSRLCRILGLPFDLAALDHVPKTFARYPDEFQPLLKDLAAWDPLAEDSAEHVLGGDFPAATRMAEEIAALESRVVDADGPRRISLEKRISKLRGLLVLPRTVSRQRMGTLRSKLERRLSHARLQRWETKLLATLQSGLTAELGTAPPTDWLTRPEAIEVLTGLGGLNRHFRSLALRLLGLTLGPAPWDLRDQPANTLFLAGLERRDIKIGAWLDGIAPVEVHANGQLLSISLEVDPLEVMRMGAPFETCLAPGAFNFFSTVSNAADINKRVLYARDAGGAIHARCLLALTDDGHIVTFHVYAHKRAAELIEGVTAFVKQLAAAMGTTVVARGEIRKLIASDWYDDGPQDLIGQLGFLTEGSDFVTALSKLPPSMIVERLRDALNGAAITPSIVCLLARQPSVQERPEIVLPLLAHVGDMSRLDPWSRMALVTLIRRAGDVETAALWLEPLVRSVLRQTNADWLQVEVAKELLALKQPHRALRLIRQTRSRWVDDWSDDWHERTLLAAQSLRALRRPHQALELSRIAAQGGSREAQDLADALARELAGNAAEALS